MVITNPLVSVFLGVVVFGDSFGKGFLSALGAVLGLLVMSSGVWLLSSSSLVRAGEELPSSAA
jgi:EamA domain-containing membrane protein RarD